MNDTYVEVMVNRKKNPLLDAGRIACYVLAIICLVLAAISPFTLLFIACAVIFAAAAYFVLPRFDIEYEYLYIDKEITIDKIMSKEKRKNVTTIDLNRLEVMAPVRSHELDSYRARGLKECDYTSGEEDAKVYSVVCSEGDKGMFIANIEPGEKMLAAIKTVFPRKVIEY